MRKKRGNYQRRVEQEGVVPAGGSWWGDVDGLNGTTLSFCLVLSSSSSSSAKASFLRFFFLLSLSLYGTPPKGFMKSISVEVFLFECVLGSLLVMRLMTKDPISTKQVVLMLLAPPKGSVGILRVLLNIFLTDSMSVLFFLSATHSCLEVA
ncbi:hypothetical protein Tco_1262869 [Tanacetum coccineum]|uniref:Uncharacterized protein n=1 Tax=Tanacetum coccineum TaxID=301880 RepID=A0ABQ5HPE4_9ASTR